MLVSTINTRQCSTSLHKEYIVVFGCCMCHLLRSFNLLFLILVLFCDFFVIVIGIFFNFDYTVWNWCYCCENKLSTTTVLSWSWREWECEPKSSEKAFQNTFFPKHWILVYNLEFIKLWIKKFLYQWIFFNFDSSKQTFNKTFLLWTLCF